MKSLKALIRYFMIPIDKDNFKQTNDLYCYINAFESRRAARGILFA